jgi:hypothetical protein
VAELGAEELVARSQQLLAAVGFAFIPLLHPIGPWEILCVSPRGLTLVAPVTAPPSLMGGRYTVPAGWPATTVRLILIWGDGALPRALTLS